MNRRFLGTASAALAATIFIAGSAHADVSAALKMCAGCHGEDGIGTMIHVPIIAGIPAIVQEDALFAYMDGDRNCGTQPLMCNMVSKLTEEQVTELAAHYAAMPFKPAGEEFDAANAAKGKAIHDEHCVICHGTDGPGDAESGILHGQRKEYLRYALQQYAAGERQQLPAMERKTRALSADEIEALVDYYASYRE